MKIIGYTVGTTMPKPNLAQTDPNKGDYVKNKDALDDRYYTEEEIDSKLDALESRYYTEAEIDQKLDLKADASVIPTKIADLADDETHRTVSDAEKEAWNSKLDGPVQTDNIVHGESKEVLSNILETYILSIDYSLLAFDTSEIVINGSSSDDPGTEEPDDTLSATNAILGYAVLGQMILG